ncbi:MAG: hypothetical protein Q8876_06005 [Bacillota bacterium]|nr:hypothetical protein [Bacillota bacterium]
MYPYHFSEHPDRKPVLPPPQAIPTFFHSREQVQEKVLKMYVHHIVFIWMSSGHSFWFYPIKIESDKILGYIWSGTWSFYKFNLNLIESFY